MKTVMIPLCLTIIFLSGLVSVGATAQVAPDDWQTMQGLQRLLTSRAWLHAEDVGPLLPARAQLQELIAKYGEDQRSRVWSDKGTVPQAWCELDLSDESAVRAYQTARDATPATERKGHAYPVQISLSELLCRAQAAIGVQLDDVEALRFAVHWTEDYVASKTSGDTLFGVPGWYRPCRERLVQLEAQAGQPEVTPVAFVGSTPICLSNNDVQLYLRLVSLPIPLQLLHWDPEHKTAVFGDSRLTALTVAQSVAEVDGVSVKLSAPPRIEDGRLMISVRDVKPLFGLDYKWDPKLWAVRIFSPET